MDFPGCRDEQGAAGLSLAHDSFHGWARPCVANARLIFFNAVRNKPPVRRIISDEADATIGSVFSFYKAESLSEKVSPMRFRAILKKCLSTSMLAAAGMWLSGCSETTTTTKPPSSSPAKVYSDGSAKPSGDASDGKSGGSDESTKSTDSDEQAGSTTGGREVPEATP